MTQLFKLDEYINGIEENRAVDTGQSTLSGKMGNFNKLCESIMDEFNLEWENDITGFETILERQKRAIIGYEKEVKYFKDKINEYLKERSIVDRWYPKWYKDLVDAVFQENWGLSGISEWVSGGSDLLKGSSSAKIIGDRIYFLIDGTLRLQPQKIDYIRRRQLRKALLLKTPKKKNGCKLSRSLYA